MKNNIIITLDCEFNQLTTLDVSNNTKLEYLDCYNNQLTNLDLSNNTELKLLYCDNNPNLKEVIISKGQQIDIYKDEHTKIIEK